MDFFDEPEGLDDNHDRALEVFQRHPGRALSAKELSIIMDEPINDTKDYIEALSDEGYLRVDIRDAIDGSYQRYRLA